MGNDFVGVGLSGLDAFVHIGQDVLSADSDKRLAVAHDGIAVRVSGSFIPTQFRQRLSGDGQSHRGDFPRIV